jgi:hypothetical protein
MFQPIVLCRLDQQLLQQASTGYTIPLHIQQQHVVLRCCCRSLAKLGYCPSREQLGSITAASQVLLPKASPQVGTALHHLWSLYSMLVLVIHQHFLSCYLHVIIACSTVIWCAVMCLVVTCLRTYLFLQRTRR